MKVNDEGAYDPTGYLLLLFVGCLTALWGVYDFIQKARRCSVPMDAHKVIINEKDLSDKKNTSNSVDDIYSPINYVYAIEYYYEGQLYRKRYGRRLNRDKINYEAQNSIRIKVNPDKPSEYFYSKDDILGYLIVVVFGLLLASPVLVMIVKSLLSGEWLNVDLSGLFM